MEIVAHGVGIERGQRVSRKGGLACRQDDALAAAKIYILVFNLGAPVAPDEAINKLELDESCQRLTDALCMSERAKERRQAQAYCDKPADGCAWWWVPTGFELHDVR